MKTEQKKFSFQTALKPIKWRENLNKSKLNVLSVAEQSFSVEYGKVSESAGQFAIRSLEEAVKALQKNKVDVLVTLPIHKQAFQLAGFKYPGHTDYLNEKLQGDCLMFMVHENLKVALVTDHIPIQKVAQAISEDLLRQKIDSLLKSLKLSLPNIFYLFFFQFVSLYYLQKEILSIISFHVKLKSKGFD